MEIIHLMKYTLKQFLLNEFVKEILFHTFQSEVSEQWCFTREKRSLIPYPGSYLNLFWKSYYCSLKTQI